MELGCGETLGNPVYPTDPKLEFGGLQVSWASVCSREIVEMLASCR